MGRRSYIDEGENIANRDEADVDGKDASSGVGGLSRRQYLGAASTAMGLTVGASTALADHGELPTLQPNRPEITSPQPIVDENLSIAHYMSGMLPHRYGEEFYVETKYYDAHGPHGHLGGSMLHSSVPSLLYYGKDSTRDEPILDENLPRPDSNIGIDARKAALLELRAAKRFGVDGFDFYYPWIAGWTGYNQYGYQPTSIMDRYNHTIAAFFEVAEQYDIDFNFTVCVSHPKTGALSIAETAQQIGHKIRDLMDVVGQDSEKWLRTSDGRHFFYTWLPSQISASDPFQNHGNGMRQIAEAFELIGHAAGVDAAWMYDVQGVGWYREATDTLDILSEYGNAVLDYFPAVKRWARYCHHEPGGEWLAQQCETRGRTFSQDVMGDFFTGKLWQGAPIGSGGVLAVVPSDLEDETVDSVYRWGEPTNLTENFRLQLGNAIDRDADMINLTTWNDYAEGHHIAPEVSHNFGYAQLFQYYVARWKDNPADAPGEVAIAFAKKYTFDTTPNPYDIQVEYNPIGYENGPQCGVPSDADAVEVVTILDAPSQLQVNDDAPVSVDSGLQVTRFPLEPGHIDVTVTRDGGEVTSFTTPEAVTTSPFRTDRLTYSFSSNFEDVYADIYTDTAPVYSANQYGSQELVDGPHYYENAGWEPTDIWPGRSDPIDPPSDGNTNDDTEPPTAPSNLTAVDATLSSVSLDWDAASERGGSWIDHYNVYVDGVKDHETSPFDTATEVSGLDPGTGYDFSVTAVDAAGNESVPSNTVSETTDTPDTTAPTVPTNLTVNTGLTSANLDWDASTDEGRTALDFYRVFVDGVEDQTVPAGTTHALVDGLAADTSYEFSVTAVDGAGNESAPATVTASTRSPNDQSPYNGPHTVPCRIQAEDYDVGGEGISYHDTSSGNVGGAYRTGDVDIETSSEGGYNVGWLRAGEWIEYTIQVESTGTYDFNAHVASGSGSGTFSVSVDGSVVLSSVSFPGTGGWQTWTTISPGHVTLDAGEHIVRISVEEGDWNLNWVEFTGGGGDTVPPSAPSNLTVTGRTATSVSLDWVASSDSGTGVSGYYVYVDGSVYLTVPAGTTSTTVSGLSSGTTYQFTVTAVDAAGNESAPSNAVIDTTDTAASGQSAYDGPHTLPGRVQAENYDAGGEGVAYHDTTVGNTGGAYRDDDVDIEVASEGGYNVGWIRTNEWLEYTVQVDSTGTYDLSARVASGAGRGTLHVEVDGSDVTGTVSFAATGGWQSWTDLSLGSVELSAGEHVVQMYSHADDWNFNWFEVSSGDGATQYDARIVTASTAPVIDGSVDAVWSDANEYAIDTITLGSRTGPGDVSGSWRALWDSQNLYVLVEVTDDSLTSDSIDWWADDTVELYIDGDGSSGTSYDGENDFQFGFRHGDQSVYTGGNSVSDTTGIQHSWGQTGSGYRFEVAIPWSTIGVSASTGHVLGFDVAIDDDDDGGTRDAQILWHDSSGTAWSDPSVFGSAELL